MEFSALAQASPSLTFDPAAKLGLSAARFGLDWTSGVGARVNDAQVRAVLDRAAAAGVRVLDASSAYGEAETTLGVTLPSPNPFKVVVRASAGPSGDQLDAAARASLATLWLPSADTLLVSRAASLTGGQGPALWSACEALRGEGLFERIGFAADVGDDVLGLARRYRPDVVQLPVSLLDQRLVQDGTLLRVADAGVEVHLRCIFLHGLLFVPLERLPGRLKGSAARLKHVRQALGEAGVDPLAAALRFALDRPEAACVLVGAAGPSEFGAVLAAAASDLPDLDWPSMALDDPTLLDPRRWAA